MGASKSRNLVSLARDDEQEVFAVIRDDYGRETRHALEELSAGETLKALSLAFPDAPKVSTGKPGSPWMRYNLEERVDAIRTGNLPADWSTRRGTAKLPTSAFAPKATSEPEEASEPTSEPEPAKVEPAPASSATGSLDALVAKIAADAARGSIDEAKVRAIVQEETANLRPHVTSIQVGEHEPTEIQGRQHHRFGTLVKLLRTEHVLLVGPAGTGKSTMAHNAANALSLEFHSISVGPTTTETKLFGFIDATGNYHRTGFREAYEHGHLFLIDELDNGNPGVTASLNQALSNGTCAFPDGMIKRHDRFRCVATGNTFGTGATAQYVGRQPIDAALRDRFGMLWIDTDEDLELDLARACSATHGESVAKRIQGYRKNAEAAGLKVLITPRATMRVCNALESGLTLEEALDVAVFAGLTDEQRERIAR